MATLLNHVPKGPAVYALDGASADVASVGMAKNLRNRLDQHLVRRR